MARTRRTWSVEALIHFDETMATLDGLREVIMALEAVQYDELDEWEEDGRLLKRKHARVQKELAHRERKLRFS